MASRQLEESIEGIGPPWRSALGVDLALGSTNYHEDLHFSTFYLRASLADAAQPLYPGYSAIIALFERGCETYYVPRREAEKTALSIIDRALRRPRWLPLILERIERLSRKVAAVLEGTVASGLATQSTGRLLQAYERHNRLHYDLYRLARLPEALDRGSPWFTDYLLECLRGRSVREDDLFFVFDAMTRPKVPSVVSEAEASFHAIAQAAQAGHGARDDALSLMSLSPAVREALTAYAGQWDYLYYHGYRNRRLPSLAEHAQRLGQVANVKDASPPPGLCGARGVPIPIFDEPHAALFAAYAEIGRVKLARRYAQLKNFYFLDQLLAEFSHRLGVSEWEVRCGTPEEVSQALRTGAWPDTVSTRLDGCAVLFTPGREEVLSGGLMEQLRTELRVAECSRPHPRIRRGTPACLGFAEGRARFLPTTGPIERFDEGDVLVADTIDPDLLPIILKASAVITQQGGVGSHAAVLCRELGIPTIVGISDLLDFCSDGEVLRVDATKGTVERCDPVIDSILVGHGSSSGEAIGRKAANLRRAEGAGVRVPSYRLLSWDQLLHRTNARAEERTRAVQRLALGLAPPNNGMPDYIIRSSALDEDAGRAAASRSYRSVPFKLEETSAALARFKAANELRGYRGAVILQRFLPASACGVWLDVPEGGGLDEAIVEAVPGPFNIVTSGTGEVARFRIGRHGELSSDGPSRLPGLPLENLVRWIRELRPHFPGLLCVEWGLLGEDFWLYQVRQLGSA